MNSLATSFNLEVTTHTLLDRVDVQRSTAFEDKNNTATRSALGQFFTPSDMATFMADFFEPLPETVHLLDPGAGTGALCSAFAIKAINQSPKIKRLHVTAWEIDASLIPLLRSTVDMIASLCKQHGVEFEAQIEQGDFIQNIPPSLKNGPLFGSGLERFDCVLMNPPYKKIHSSSVHRLILSNYGLETVNLYTAFLWLAAKDLKPGGQLVSINPRSFANGPYYYPFRKTFLNEMTVKRAHLFNSRKDAFKDDSVLQENVVFHAIKERSQDSVVITSSDNLEDLKKERRVPQTHFANSEDPELFIHLVADEKGGWIRSQMHQFKATLKDIGINVSTGRVVDFRAKGFLQREQTAESVPLIYPGHFNCSKVIWPREDFKKCNYFKRCQESESQLVEAGYYVLIKRFTAKEEKRRIVSVVISPKEVPASVYGFENHLNYLHQNGKGLPPDLARGLSGFLNSTLVDEYFRQFNGHTQVNATDLKTMRFPARETLIAFGRKIDQRHLEQEQLDTLFSEHFISMADTQNDPIKAKKKIEEALDILKQLEVPKEQQNERSALTLLALLGHKPETKWHKSASILIGITQMMDWFRDHFGVTYAPNTRETVRRQTIHQFFELGIAIANPDQPDRPVNSPNFGYEIEPSALELFSLYGKREWKKALTAYKQNVQTLRALHHKERKMNQIEITLPDGRKKWLSGGGQNVLIKAVIDDFCPRYTPGGYACYLGDAGEKMTDEEQDYFKDLGVELDTHGKMPDIVVHLKNKNWLVLIEAVTSHGPIDNKRKIELEKLFAGSTAELVFITAFSTRKVMMNYFQQISWETDVWLAENPTHLIHFDGEKFLGPY